MAVLGELLHLDFTNFQQDLNKGLENSLEANTKIFDRLKLKAEQLCENKNSNK